MITGDSPEVIQAVLDQYDLVVPVLDDRNRSLARLLGVSGLPSGFLFDREGRLIEQSVGWHREHSLPAWKKKVENALK
jgi:peroxiredoxin